jgi:hypothetical protein
VTEKSPTPILVRDGAEVIVTWEIMNIVGVKKAVRFASTGLRGHAMMHGRIPKAIRTTRFDAGVRFWCDYEPLEIKEDS